MTRPERFSTSPLNDSSNRTATRLTAALGIWLFVMSLGLYFGLDGREIGSDVSEYHLYVAEPWQLLQPLGDRPLYGGRVAAPLLPVLIGYPYRVFHTLGLPPFLAFRATMCGYTLAGIWLVWSAILRERRTETRRDIVAAATITFLPLTWIATAVLAQDECIALAWSGLCFWLWRRSGPLACQRCALVGIFIAKIFFVLIPAALWIAYPRHRVRIAISTSLAVAGLVGFFYARDGGFTPAGHSVNGMASATWCTVIWLWQGGKQQLELRRFTDVYYRWGTILTMTGLGIYGLALLRRRPTPSAAIVALYTVFFTFHIGMMPEYEMWYFPWVMFLMYAAASRGAWGLFAALGLHNVLGYVYKILYVCDEYNVVNQDVKPLRAYYNQYIDLNLRWPMLVAAVATLCSGIAVLILLWREKNDVVESPFVS